MSRKAFLIWGLAIIAFFVAAHAVISYLSLSKMIDVKTIGATAMNGIITCTILGFAIILHLRFKAIGRRKRTLALCLPFFIASIFAGGFAAVGFLMADIFGAHDKYFNVISEWAALPEPKPAPTWSTAETLNYVFLQFTSTILISYWGLFALLWFGSLDPRKPSKNAFLHFMKHGRFRARNEKKTVMNSTISAVT